MIYWNLLYILNQIGNQLTHVSGISSIIILSGIQRGKRSRSRGRGRGQQTTQIQSTREARSLSREQRRNILEEVEQRQLEERAANIIHLSDNTTQSTVMTTETETITQPSETTQAFTTQSIGSTQSSQSGTQQSISTHEESSNGTSSISSTNSQMSEHQVESEEEEENGEAGQYNLSETSTLNELDETFQRAQREDEERQLQYFSNLSENELPRDSRLRYYLKLSEEQKHQLSPESLSSYEKIYHNYQQEKFILHENGKIDSQFRLNIPYEDAFLQAYLRKHFGEPGPGIKYWPPSMLTQIDTSSSTIDSSRNRFLQSSNQQRALEDQQRRIQQSKEQADAIFKKAEEKAKREREEADRLANLNSSSSTNSSSSATTTGIYSTVPPHSEPKEEKWVELKNINPDDCGSKVYELAGINYRESHLFKVDKGILLARNEISKNIYNVTEHYNTWFKQMIADQQKQNEINEQIRLEQQKKIQLDQIEKEKQELEKKKLNLQRDIIDIDKSIETDTSKSVKEKFAQQQKQAQLVKTGSLGAKPPPQLNISRAASMLSSLSTSTTIGGASTGTTIGSASVSDTIARTQSGFSSRNGGGPSGPGRNGSGKGKPPPGPPPGPPNGPSSSGDASYQQGGARGPIFMASNEFSIVKYITPKPISNNAKFEDSTKWISFKSAFLANAQQNNYVDWITRSSIDHWEELFMTYNQLIKVSTLYIIYRQLHKQITGLIKTNILKIYSTPELLDDRTIQNGILLGFADTRSFDINEKLEVGGAFSDDNCFLFWNTLSELHQKRMSMDLVKLIRDLYSFRWSTRQDMSQQLASFLQLTQRLNEASIGRTILPGHLLPQSVEASFLLASLPPELEQVNISLGTQENLTIEQVFSTIQSVVSNYRAKKAYGTQSHYAHSSYVPNNKYNNNRNNNNHYKNNNYKNSNSSQYSKSNNYSSSNSNSNFNKNKQNYSFVTGDSDQEEHDNEDTLNNDTNYDEENSDNHENKYDEDENNQHYEFGSDDEVDDNANYTMILTDFSHQKNQPQDELDHILDDEELLELQLPVTPSEGFENTFSDIELEDEYQFPIIQPNPDYQNSQDGGVNTIEYPDDSITIPAYEYYQQLTDVELQASILDEIHSSEPDGNELAGMIKVMNDRCNNVNIHLHQYGKYINYRSEMLEIPLYTRMSDTSILAQIQHEIYNAKPNFEHFYYLVNEQINRIENDIIDDSKHIHDDPIFDTSWGGAELDIKTSIEYLQKKLKEVEVKETSTQTEINSSIIQTFEMIEQENERKRNEYYAHPLFGHSLVLHVVLSTFDQMLSNPYTFVLDSGATRHVTGNQRILFDTRVPKYDFTIKSIYGHFEKVKLIGSIKITSLIKINNVHYLPGAKYNLISVSKLNERGVEINFNEHGAYCKHGGSTFLKFKPVMGLFIFQNEKFSEKEQPSIEYIHRSQDRIVPKPSNKNEPISRLSDSSSKPKPSSSTQSSIISSQPKTSVIPSVPQSSSKQVIHPPRRKIPKKKQFYQPANRPTTRSTIQPIASSTAGAASTISSNSYSLVTHQQEDYDYDLHSDNDDDEMYRIGDDYALSINNNSTAFATMFEDEIKNKNIKTTSINEQELKLLHLQLGHKRLTKEVLQSLNLHSSYDLTKLKCNICSLVKLTNRPTGRGEFHQTKQPNEKWGFDTTGPFTYKINNIIQNLISKFGNKYLFNIIDYFSRYAWTFPIHSKGEATQWLIKLIIKVNYQNNVNKVKSIHSDNAAEFVSKELVQFCETTGIIKTTTPAYSPSLNGMIERFNRTIVEIIKSMLATSDLHQQFYDEAAKYAVFIYNNTPNKQINYQTPQQVQLGFKTNLKMLYVFGSNVYYKLAPVQNKVGKLQVQTKIGIFIGYQSDQVFAYRILGENNKIVISRNAVVINGQFDHIKKLNYQAITRSIIHETIEDQQIDEDDDNDLPIQYTIQPEQSIIQPTITEQIMENEKQKEIQIQVEQEQIQNLSENIEQLESIENEMNIESMNGDQLEYEPHYPDEEFPLYDISEESTQHTSPESVESMETTPESIEETIRSESPTESVRENIISELPPTEPSVSRFGRRRIARTRYGQINPLDLDPISRRQAFGFMHSINQVPIKIEYGFINDTNGNQQITKLKDKIIIPYTLTQALNGTESKQWLEATDTEIENMIVTNSFTLVENPELITKKPIPSRLLYSLKYDMHNDIEAFKCRLIALGYRQKQGIDYNEIYSPVCKLKSILVVLSIAVQYGFKVVTLDFTSAFMNAEIDTETFISLPLDVAIKYFNVENSSQNVFKLNRALYGLHQSPILWFNTIRNFLINILHYVQLNADVCVFIKITSTGMIIVTVYVDDTIGAYDEQSESIWLQDKIKIQDNFKIKDLGSIKSILKLQIIQVNPHVIIINQKNYVEKLAKQYNLTHVTPTYNPEIKNFIEGSSNLLNKTDITRFQSLTGALNYIATKTRPDISFSVNQLSRQLVKPTELHWKGAIKILKYLITTASLGLVLQKQNKGKSLFSLEVYADAAHGNQPDSKSTLGYLSFFNGNLISWNTMKAKVVSISTMESELYAIMEGLMELIFFKKLIFELTKSNVESTLYTDSTSAKALIISEQYHARAKHLKIKMHYIRDQLNKKVFEIKWIDTARMLADLNTKFIGTNQFKILRDQILYDTNSYIKSNSSSNSN